MAIKDKDIKILWGRSGNRCAICKVLLTEDASSTTSSFTLGEQAHIVGDKPTAARPDSKLTSEEKDSYDNLILLCPTHHTEIDKNESDWPIDRLHQSKLKHETWVAETLNETADQTNIAKQATIDSIVDAATSLCNFENWESWTSFALSPDPRWQKQQIEMFFSFRKKIISAIWLDKYENVKRSAITLSILLNRAAQKYLEYAVLNGDYYYPIKFYKTATRNPNYNKDLALYEAWLDECYALIYQATKAANWFADSIREDVNPMFFAVKGKFLITEGPFMDLSFRTKLLEFSDSEKKSMPEAVYEST